MDRLDEASVVALRLIGVGLRELPQRIGERGALARVAEDHIRVAGPAVGKTQRVTTAMRIADQRTTREHRRVDGALHVLELAHIEAASVQRRPAEEGVADSLHHPAAHHHALAVGQQRLLAERRLDRRGLGLLDLQHQLVVQAVAHEEHEVVVGAHATDADHFVRDVDDVVRGEIRAALDRQPLEVGAQR